VTATTWIINAADAAAVVEHLDLKNTVHIGHPTGGGEVARYIAKYGQMSPPARSMASIGRTRRRRRV
jgi:non-heme chloroperoxidase